MSARERVGLVEHLRWQADACEDLGSPLYASLLRRLAADAAEDGITAQVLRGHGENLKDMALALRLLGGVHRLVLSGDTPALAVHYPSVGGDGDAEAAAAPFLAVLAEHEDAVRDALGRTPQTNEVGRAATLVGALCHLINARPLPVRLIEIGSIERTGCDPHPLDPTTDDGALTLSSYVWPDQPDRLARLRGALAIAGDVPAAVEQARAAEFLTRAEPQPGSWLVVWHSIMWPDVGLGSGERVIAHAAPHGIPVEWV